MMLVSPRDVEEGIKHARTTAACAGFGDRRTRAADPSAARAKAATLDFSSDATRAGIRDMAWTLKEYETRLDSLEAQKRSTAVATEVAEGNHNTYIS